MPRLDHQMIMKEYEGVDLGDARLDARLARMVPLLAAEPEGSFPEQMKSEADQEAVYRFVNNERVTLAGLLEGHRQQTLARVAGREVVRIVHDTTDFVFDGERDGLTPLKSKGLKRGFLAHFALALSGDEKRTTLGVLGVRPFLREHTAQELKSSERRLRASQVPRDKKKSSRWEKLALEVCRDIPPGTTAIHIMDQEADDFSVFSALRHENERFVIRVEPNRRNSEKVPAEELLSRSPSQVLRPVFVSRRSRAQAKKAHPERDERTAELNVQAATITLARTQWAKESELAELTLNAVHVFEPSPPQDVEPIDWMLFTSEPIGTLEEIATIVDHYRARWVIEEYFKALKTGCSFEKRQLTSYDGLLRALGLFVPMAWMLLTLRNLSRDDPTRSAAELLTPVQILLLRALLTKQRRTLPLAPTVREAMLGIAALGGHIKNNGDPGWLVLGRGLRRFCEAEEIWALRPESCDQS
jgi:hypothetical protein